MARILVTNDDGVESRGLHVLAEAMASHGEVVVVAPEGERSGSSAALGALQHVHPTARRAEVPGASVAWAVDGTPALCVTFARLGAFGGPFDLVVAGINPGANVGRSVYHSGTVGAVLTACAGGTSGVAVSQAVPGAGVEGQAGDAPLEGQCWPSAASVAGVVVASLLAAPPASPVAVNLNVPNRPLADIEGWRHTVVGRVPTRALAGVDLQPVDGDPARVAIRMRWGRPVSLPPETDGGAVERGQVSMTLLGPLAEGHPEAAPAVVGALDRLLPAR